MFFGRVAEKLIIGVVVVVRHCSNVFPPELVFCARQGPQWGPDGLRVRDQGGENREGERERERRGRE